MRTERWYLGVDGGGTKTAVVVMDGQGRICTMVEGPACVRIGSGWAAPARTIRSVVAKAERRARIRPHYTAACFALAGVETSAHARVAHAAVRRSFGRRVEQILVVNDTFAALRAGTNERYGAVVIAGTGSNALAHGPKGDARAGGWGRILGDDGSGYWIGRAALRATLRSFDGRGPQTALRPALARALRARNFEQMVGRLARSDFSKREVSLLSRVVDQLSRTDRVAHSILQEAAVQLVEMATTAARRAGLGRSAFPLVVSGGCFKAPILLRTFRIAAHHVLPQARIVVPRVAPVVGAALLAKETA